MTAPPGMRPAPHPLLRLADVRRYLSADIEQYRKYSAGLMQPRRGWVRTFSILLTPPLQCCLLYRLSHWAFCTGRRRLAAMLAGINLLLHKCAISPGSSIGPGVYIPHPTALVFHGHAGARLTLYHRAVVCAGRPYLVKDEVYADCPVLGDDVTVGVNNVVSGGIVVGSGSYLAAMATVREDLPANTLVVDTNVKTSRPRESPASAAAAPTPEPVPPAPVVLSRGPISWHETRTRLVADRARVAAFRTSEGADSRWLLLDPSYLCLFLYRIAHYLHGRDKRMPARVLWQLNLWITGADFSPKTDVGGGALVKHPARVALAGKVGANCVFHGHGAVGGLWEHTDRDVGGGPGLPALGDFVEMEDGALVAGPFRIGNRVRIGARCLVSKDVPDGATVVLVEPRRPDGKEASA